jgi:Zn-finger in ubiquitin-hydrolases and other protein
LDTIQSQLIKAVSAKKQSEIKAWEEEEIKPCSHTESLVQVDALKLEGKSLAHCKDCELNSNLWLCMTCGNLGCGRAQYGGILYPIKELGETDTEFNTFNLPVIQFRLKWDQFHQKKLLVS